MKTPHTVRRRKTNEFEEEPTSAEQQAQAKPSEPIPAQPNSSQDSQAETPSVDEIPQPKRPEPVCAPWTNLTENYLHKGIRGVNVSLATTAAKYPKRCVLLITLFSFGVVIAGLFTNFTLIFSHNEIFTPVGSRPKQHGDWVDNDSNFDNTADFIILVHSEGENVMNVDALQRAFLALDTVRNMSGYKELCAQSHYLNAQNEHDCWIWSATNFWNHNVTEFHETVQDDEDVARMLSQTQYQDGTPVFHEAILGKYKAVNETLVYNAMADKIFHYQHENDYLTYAPNYVLYFGMPEVDDVWDLQEKLLNKLTSIRTTWQEQSEEENPHNVQMEFFCGYAYELEYARALATDFPLIPVVFFVMLGFTCFIFHRYGLMQVGAPTRATIGMASVVTVGMSMMSGFGIMFCLGVPFTNVTLMAPFIILGVGLDDTFIITGAYFRRIKEEIQEREKRKEEGAKKVGNKTLLMDGSSTEDRANDSNSLIDLSMSVEQLYDHSKIVERVRSSMEEVGLSISLTTLTTTAAFILGCLSSVPGIRWLCLYSSVTIIFDSLYQVTYFVALLTLDERRVVLAQAKELIKREKQEEQQRQSWCANFYSWVSEAYSNMLQRENSNDESSAVSDGSSGLSSSAVFVERFMAWYARTLLKPPVRNSVIILCMALFAVCIYSTTQLTQKFDPEDYVPDDSYIQGFFARTDDFSSLRVTLELYFRDVDQSDPIIQEQMREYVYELSALPQINKQPEFCWVIDMAPYLEGNFEGIDFSELTDEQADQAAFLADFIKSGDNTFEETLDLILSIPAVRDIYGEDIVRNEAGEITASRCYIYIREFDLDDVRGQVDFLHKQRAITASQPINQLPEYQNEWAFFADSSFHGYWELYDVAIQELIFTTISGVLAVCAVGFIIIPHWTAVLFVGPIIIMLYFDLLGIMQFCGIHINALTYVTIVISIGLLVDFLMHLLLRYYESPGSTREAKVRRTLETMGASMMLGGFTTWLGVLPMALSSTYVFTTIFIAYLAMVSLGLLIGLAFLPAVLSVCGPIVCVNTHNLGESQPEQPKCNAAGDSPTSAATGGTTGDRPVRTFPNTYQLGDAKEPESLTASDADPNRILGAPSWDLDQAPGTATGAPILVMEDDEEEDFDDLRNEKRKSDSDGSSWCTPKRQRT